MSGSLTGNVLCVTINGVRYRGSLVAVVALGVAVAGVALAAQGAAAAVDRAEGASGSWAATVEHRVGISGVLVGPTRSKVDAGSGTVALKALRFAVGLDLLSERGGDLTTDMVRMTLPRGLSWGERPATLHDWSFTPESQSCAVSGQVVTCQVVGVPSNTQSFGWILDVVAAAPGMYTISGEVVQPADGRNRVPRGAETPPRAEATLIVGERSGAVVASRLVLSRPDVNRPSWLYATTKITQGGVPTRADSLTCTHSFPSSPSPGKTVNKAEKGSPLLIQLAPLGYVRCLYGFNNSRYRGETLVGEMTFTVGATTITRKFTVRIGSGVELSAPTGAVIDAKP